MKNTVPPRALRGRGFTGAAPPTAASVISISNENVAGRVPKKNGFRGGRERESRSVSGFFGRPKTFHIERRVRDGGRRRRRGRDQRGLAGRVAHAKTPTGADAADALAGGRGFGRTPDNADAGARSAHPAAAAAPQRGSRKKSRERSEHRSPVAPTTPAGRDRRERGRREGAGAPRAAQARGGGPRAQDAA